MSLSAPDYERVALFDLDGSLADYDLAMRRDLQPLRAPKAWTEKVEWCKEQPELVTADIHLTMNKGLVYGTFLYDDYPVYMDLWLANRPRGLGVMLTTPDNAPYAHPNVVKWDGTNLEEVQRAMQIAYDRAPRTALLLA
ncbi:MAG: hypothetical protein ABR975_01660 [Vulcanimicrobiaceae bacterium]|jgi:hypothetical protein